MLTACRSMLGQHDPKIPLDFRYDRERELIIVENCFEYNFILWYQGAINLVIVQIYVDRTMVSIMDDQNFPILITSSSEYNSPTKSFIIIRLPHQRIYMWMSSINIYQHLEVLFIVNKIWWPN